MAMRRRVGPPPQPRQWRLVLFALVGLSAALGPPTRAGEIAPGRSRGRQPWGFQTPPGSQPPPANKGGGKDAGSSNSNKQSNPGLPFTSKLLESSSAAGAWTTTAPSPSPSNSSRKPPAKPNAAATSTAAASLLPVTTTAVTVTGPGPFRLVLDEATDRFAFQTATIRLAQRPCTPTNSSMAAAGDDASRGGRTPRVRLVGSVHIADPEYYQALEAKVDGCDVVLYEMITSERNVFRDASDPSWPGREQLGVELAATPALRQMALAHGLEPQLDNMRFFGRRHWYLSDISRERLCALQRARGERALDEGDPEALAKDAPTDLILARFPYLGEMAQMFWEGFTSRGKVLPKFLSLRGDLSKAPFRLLRFCMWLTPAPELQLMLLDWARQYPPAGGLSKILRSMVGALVHADFLTLRRLAFSQMLTSSQGSPPPEVLVLERNSKVVLDVAHALEAAQAQAAASREMTKTDVEVAVLYGGLHLKDMEEKLVRHLNFTRDASDSSDAGIEWTTAWTMPAYTSTRPALVAALCVTLPLLYLGIGAADWSATFGDIAHHIALGGTLRPEGSEAPTHALSALTYEAVREAALYVFRHLALYWGLTRWVVEWERQLFELK